MPNIECSADIAQLLGEYIYFRVIYCRHRHKFAARINENICAN